MAIASTTWWALGAAACGAAYVVASRQGSVRAAAAGMVVATAAILGLGPGALAPLAVFVLGGGALTRWGMARKRAMAVAEPNEGRRSTENVIAKLGIPALVAATAPWSGHASALAVAFVAALAGALADTAGTEVGPLARGPAFALRGTRLARVDHGTAGAVSAAGVAATAAGASVVAATAALSGLAPSTSAALGAAASGFVAALLESLVGASGAGPALGHFGRNVFVSAAAAALGFAAGLASGVKP